MQCALLLCVVSGFAHTRAWLMLAFWGVRGHNDVWGVASWCWCFEGLPGGCCLPLPDVLLVEAESDCGPSAPLPEGSILCPP